MNTIHGIHPRVIHGTHGIHPLAKTLPSFVNNLVENHLVRDNICNLVNLQSPKAYKEWQIMLTQWVNI